MREAKLKARPWLWASVVFSGLGILVSGYLAAKHLTGEGLACTRWAQCDVVNNSMYAKIYGVPVSFVGLAGYLVLLLLAIAALRSSGTTQRQILLVSFLLALGGVGFSIYLTYIELFVIEAICSWCLASAVLITLLALSGGVGVWRSAGPPLGG